jgi:oligopeptide transport system ATP-binding protein
MDGLSARQESLLRVEDLKVYFSVRGGLLAGGARTVKAVDGVSLDIARGQTLGLVGESGCGKSSLARAVLRLIPATAGTVTFQGSRVFDLSAQELRHLRRRLQIVFQDPVGSLNPRLPVEAIVGEALTVHRLVKTARQRRERVVELLVRVGLSGEELHRYPHEFSGGQRQRIGIARALAVEPHLIICDEPVSALDVSIQAQILNLLADLRDDLGLSYLFIAHNLAVVRHICDQVAIMYLGRIVEQAPTAELFQRPQHPYTQTLLAAARELDVSAAPANARGVSPARPTLAGEPPSSLNPPTGCSFHPRCPRAEPRCRQEQPGLQPQAGLPPTHHVACYLAAQPGDAQKPLDRC